MAKTIIGMILAGSMVVTSYAATKLPTEKPAHHGLQNVHWTLDAAAEITHVDGASEHAHDFDALLGFKTSNVNGHLWIDTNTVTVDDVQVSGKLQNFDVSVGYAGRRTNFGETLNDAASANALSNDSVAGSFDPYTLRHQQISFGSTFGSFEASARIGQTQDSTSALNFLGDDHNIYGVKLGSKMHGVDFALSIDQFENHDSTLADKIDAVSLEAGTKLQMVDLKFGYKQGKVHGGAADGVEGHWYGVRAGFGLGAAHVGVEYQNVEHKIAGVSTEAHRTVLSATTALMHNVNASLAYAQDEDFAGSKTDTTGLKLSVQS